MTLAEKIFIGFFLVYGLAQTIANAYHYFSRNEVPTGRKQHGEIPKSASDREIKIKVLLMLIFGVLFLVAGIFSFTTKNLFYELFLIVLIANSTYVLTEAIYHKYWKTFSAFVVSPVPLILFILFVNPLNIEL